MASAAPSGLERSPGWAGGDGAVFTRQPQKDARDPRERRPARVPRGLLAVRTQAAQGCAGHSGPALARSPELSSSRRSLRRWPPEQLYKARAVALIRPRQRAETPPGGSGRARGAGTGSQRTPRTRGAGGTEDFAPRCVTKGGLISRSWCLINAPAAGVLRPCGAWGPREGRFLELAASGVRSLSPSGLTEEEAKAPREVLLRSQPGARLVSRGVLSCNSVT